MTFAEADAVIEQYCFGGHPRDGYRAAEAALAAYAETVAAAAPLRAEEARGWASRRHRLLVSRLLILRDLERAASPY